MESFITVMGTVLTEVPKAMGLLLEEPVVYFVALAGVAATIGVVRKLLPMRKG